MIDHARAGGRAQQHQPQMQDMLTRQDAADDDRRLALEARTQEDPDRPVLSQEFFHRLAGRLTEPRS